MPRHPTFLMVRKTNMLEPIMAREREGGGRPAHDVDRRGYELLWATFYPRHELKLHPSNSVSLTYSSQSHISIWSGMWFGVAPRTDTKNTRVFEKDGTECSKYGNHSGLNIEHNGGGGGTCTTV